MSARPVSVSSILAQVRRIFGHDDFQRGPDVAFAEMPGFGGAVAGCPGRSRRRPTAAARGENTDAYVYAAAHDALRPTAKAITDRRKTGARMCVRIAVSCETLGQSRNIAQHPGHVPYLLLS
jgi:hypothetical protein